MIVQKNFCTMSSPSPNTADNSQMAFVITNVQVDAHPTEAATLVINYNLAGKLLYFANNNSTTTAGGGGGGASELSSNKQMSRLIRINNLSRQTDNNKLADEIIASYPQALAEYRHIIMPDLLQAIKVIRERVVRNNKKSSQIAAAAQQSLLVNGNDKENAPSSRLPSRRGAGNAGGVSPGAISAHAAATASPLPPPPQQTQQQQSQENNITLPQASMKHLSIYLDKMYDDIPEKIDGAAHILALARKKTNLDVLINSDRFVSALSRVLREDHSRSLELSDLLIQIFLCFARYQHMHPLLQSVRIGSLTMEIVVEELQRYGQWKAKMLQQQQQQKPRVGDNSAALEKLKKNFSRLRRRQNTLLTSCMSMLLLLGYEQLLVQQKMMNKDLVDLLRHCMLRNNNNNAADGYELQLKCLQFLHILSLFKDNHEAILRSNVVKALVQLLLRTTTTMTMTTTTVNGSSRSQLVVSSASSSSHGRSSSAAATVQSSSSPTLELQLSILRVLMSLSFAYEFRRCMLHTTFIQALVTITKSSSSSSRTDRRRRRRRVLSMQLLYQLSTLEPKFRAQNFFTPSVLAVLYRNLQAYCVSQRKPNKDAEGEEAVRQIGTITLGILINLSTLAENVEKLENALLSDIIAITSDDIDDDAVVPKRTTPDAVTTTSNIFQSLFQCAMSCDDWRALKLLNNMARIEQLGKSKLKNIQQILARAANELAKKAASVLPSSSSSPQPPPSSKLVGRPATAAVNTAANIINKAGSPDMLCQCIEALSLIDYSNDGIGMQQPLKQFCAEHQLIQLLVACTSSNAGTTTKLLSLPDTLLAAIHLTATLARHSADCALALLSANVLTNILSVSKSLDNDGVGPSLIVAEIMYVTVQFAQHAVCRAQLVRNRALLSMLSAANNNKNVPADAAADSNVQLSLLVETATQLLTTTDDDADGGAGIRERIREEKFTAFNQGWLEAIQNRSFDAAAAAANNDGGGATDETFNFAANDADYNDDDEDAMMMAALDNDDEDEDDDDDEDTQGQTFSSRRQRKQQQRKMNIKNKFLFSASPLSYPNNNDDDEEAGDDDNEENMRTRFDIDNIFAYNSTNAKRLPGGEWQDSLAGSQQLDLLTDDDDGDINSTGDDIGTTTLFVTDDVQQVSHPTTTTKKKKVASRKILNDKDDEEDDDEITRPPSRMAIRAHRPPSARPQFV